MDFKPVGFAFRIAILNFIQLSSFFVWGVFRSNDTFLLLLQTQKEKFSIFALA